jgi:hypothetical protein
MLLKNAIQVMSRFGKVKKCPTKSYKGLLFWVGKNRRYAGVWYSTETNKIEYYWYEVSKSGMCGGKSLNDVLRVAMTERLAGNFYFSKTLLYYQAALLYV